MSEMYGTKEKMRPVIAENRRQRMNIKFGVDIYAPEEVNELARASIGYIESDVMDIKKRYVTLGFHLYEMDQCRYYEDLGYENLYECIEANFAMDKSAVSRCIGVWKAFAAVDGDGSRKMWVDDRYKDFSYSQLTEMLPMAERDRRRISSDMSVKKIREVKQRLKEKKSSENMKPVVEQEKDKISARGTRVNVREDDVVATSQLEDAVKDQPVEIVADQSDQQRQPDFPDMKNMQEREDFVNTYKDWKIWCRNDLTEEVFYRYDLPDGAAIVVKVFPYIIPCWSKKEAEGRRLYLLKPGYKHFADCESNMTSLKEYLKDLKKKK